MLGLDYNTFSKNLLLTQLYCEHQIVNLQKSNSAILRSYNPIYNGKRMFRFRYSNFSHPGMRKDFFQTDWAVDPLRRGGEKIIEELFNRQLDFKGVEIKTLNKSKHCVGDILIAKIDETVIDGASCVMSNGLIDDFDCPPIDSWFYLNETKANRRFLFSWIPQKLYELANEAVLVNCVDCLGWYKDWFPDDYLLSMQYFERYHRMS